MYTPQHSSSSESYGGGRGARGRGGGNRRSMEGRNDVRRSGGGGGTADSARDRKLRVVKYDCPRDSEGNPVTVPMRFELIKQDGATLRETTQLQQLFVAAFEDAAGEYDVTIVEKSEVRMIPVEAMLYSRWVCEFKVSCSNWQQNLTRFAHEFLYNIREHPVWKIMRFEMPILYTHSILIYPSRLINMHQDIPFVRVKFGSFINSGTIGVHWFIEGGRSAPGDEQDGFTFHKDIDSSFEYDRKQITIMFNNREPHPSDREQRYFLANYKLTLNMSSIRRIIFDQSTYDEGRRRRCSLVFLVDYPMKIQVKLKNEFDSGRNGIVNGMNGLQLGNGHNMQNQQQQQQPQARWSKFEHRLKINRGRWPDEVSDQQALHESKAVVLEFDEEDLKSRLEPADASFDAFYFDILSRLRHKTGKAVEFASFDQVDMIEGYCREYRGSRKLVAVTPYVTRKDFDDVAMDYITRAAEKVCNIRDARDLANRITHVHRVNLKVFRLRACLEGILQRGMDIRCQLLMNRDHWYTFVKIVSDRYAMDEQKTLYVLESMLSTLSEGRPNSSVMAIFNKEWNDSRSGHRTTVFTKEEERKGFTRVMKFVCTPTRLFFVGYETLMANRVLNQHSKNGTEIIRVSFRDDSGEYMREMSCGSRIIKNTMVDVLLDRGLLFAGRYYVWLGNSNSQLRDHGIYMFHEDDRKTAREIRRKLGNFHLLTSIPKWLARQGQCFTQARASDRQLEPSEIGVTFDFIGGRAASGKPYVFSDGVGTISYSLAIGISNEHQLHRIASAFQIRHKGQKGLVSVDPIIDDRNKLLKMMGKEAEKKMVLVRPSMDKFEVDETSRGGGDEVKTNLEIVKYSSPSPLFLNRPLLNILSQVAEDQSAGCYSRMSNRVVELLDSQLRNMTQSMYIEDKARETIREMSFPFAMEVFSDACPLQLTSEPFFRSMLRANAKFVLNKQLAKMQIRIPSDYGRSMFGVVDSTGILQYGQIFCQVSSSISKHAMSRGRVRAKEGADGAMIITGPVMMTKNPCIEKGDVRLFDAIDVPGLRHLVDVVVFPMHGHRPHPDEMAGSDLDGDEYSLIWDPQIRFDHNEEASLFPSGEDVKKWPIVRGRDGEVDINACEKRLAEFYIEAITQEQIGVLSNAHLATSDFYGLEAKPARSLAAKISQALDFQKNGVPPERITTTMADDPDDPKRVIPPEKSERKPDYMEKMRDAGYESRGIMGTVYREIKRYQNAIDAGEDQIEKIEIDPAFNLPDWERYREVVTRELDEYAHAIRGLLEHYGIASEGELMSGQIVSIKNRISEKEADDMNLFNTNQIIEEKVKREIAAARERFFSSLITWQTDLDQVQNKRKDVETDSILSRLVRSTTTNIDVIRRKAAAAYNVCYQAAHRCVQNGDGTSVILSFPWVFYDVLADIKLRPDERIVRVLPRGEGEEEGTVEQSNEPLAKVLSSFIDSYCAEASNAIEWAEFQRRFDGDESVIGRSMRENRDLCRATFVLIRWAHHIGGFQRGSRFREEHLIALFLLFGLGEVNVRGTRRRYIQRPSGEPRSHLKKGEHLLKFIEYIASREFRSRPSLSFKDVQSGVLLRGEWKAFSELAIPSYLSLVTVHRLSLPLVTGGEVIATLAAIICKEFEPRKMELPSDVVRTKLPEVRQALLAVSGCSEVQLRQMGCATQVFVSAIGTSEQFKLLTSFIIPPAPPREQSTLRSGYNAIPQFVHGRLMAAAAKIPPPL